MIQWSGVTKKEATMDNPMNWLILAVAVAGYGIYSKLEHIANLLIDIKLGIRD